MVKFFFITIFFMYTFLIHGQTDNHDSIEDFASFVFIDTSPYYFGGVDSMKSFIAKNLQYPKSAIRDSIEGVVYVRFWVDTNGVTIDHEVVRSVRSDLDEEAIRVLKLVVFHQPAKQKDRPIKVPFVVPVKFELSGIK